jgi:hypothetical protein
MPSKMDWKTSSKKSCSRSLTDQVAAFGHQGLPKSWGFTCRAPEVNEA